VTGDHAIHVARVYEPRSGDGELRVLVDRIWPRGLSKGSADLDVWCKEIAPSTGLRRWYAHAPSRFREFRERYLTELDDPAHAAALARLRDEARQHPVILLTAVKDVGGSHAMVLADRLRSPGERI
jgi:uncharacterized protein YeaO (DUF488 family)